MSEIAGALAGKRIFLTGATGFLGKVFLAKLLRDAPEAARVALLVRPREGEPAAARVEADILRSPALAPLGGEALADRLEAIEGDTSLERFGLPEAAWRALAGRIDVVVHCAGLVDFSPPLDEALSVNIDGTRNAIALARAAGAALVHTSTCFVSGLREGRIAEAPLGPELDAEREAAACRAIVERVRIECEDEPARARGMLRDLGKERGRRRGFPNAYTYSKAIAERLVSAAHERGEVRASIVRPAILESALRFPLPGWNQGANTTAPLLYMIHRGHRFWPTTPDHVLDVLPIDMAAGAMVAVAARAAEGCAPDVIQLGSGDTNPLPVVRAIELSALFYRRRPVPGAGPVLSMAARELLESTGVPERVYRAASLPLFAKAAELAKGVLDAAAPAALAGVRRAVGDAEKTLRKTAQIVEEYVPFIAGPRTKYETAKARALRDGLSPADRELMAFEPESIDWRKYWHEQHLPGLERWVYPELDRAAAPKKNGVRPHFPDPAPKSSPAPSSIYPTLVDLFEAATARDPTHALVGEATGAALRARVASGVARLRASGVRPGDRVALLSDNSPAWVVGYFAIVAAGATAVPLDAGLAARDVASLVRAARARLLFASAKRTVPGAESLEALAAPPENGGDELPADVAGDPERAASLIFTSGTTGAPKGVLLPHRAFCSQVAALASIYELGPQDRVLSVLPLHHAFEFTCGLLLPLASGARIAFAAAPTPEAVRDGLARVRPTAMIAVPALLDAFLRSIRREVRAKLGPAAAAFEAAIASQRALRDATGANLGPKLFAAAHEALGGSLRMLVSGGAALSRGTFEAFRGLGFDIYEGYGLTEAGPVVAASRPGRAARAGRVGEPIAGTEVRLDARGEVLVRGPGVMLGYDGDEAATSAAIDAEGWLHTGDLGRLDADGALAIVGRVKEVIVDAAGNTIYPDEVEEAYARVEDVQEIGVARVGLPEGKEVAGALVLARDEASRARVLERFKEIERELPFPKRLKVVRFADGPLPRTATRKVKREEVSRIIAAKLDEERAAPRPAGRANGVGLRARRLVAEAAGVDVATVALEARLQEDLGLDSLALVELAAQVGSDDLKTVADVAKTLGKGREKGSDPFSAAPRAGFALPSIVRSAGNAALSWLQKKAYEGPLRAEVEGRGNIPLHTNALVVANHCSHLDVGLVKHALGDYGRRAASLAARDYFFSSPLAKLYFESFTEVLPLDRQDLARDRLDGVVERLAVGESVILFPEGTRSTTGEMGPFRPGIGYLVMKARVGVLPMVLRGTHEALPKGAKVLRARDLGAKIGRFLPYEELAAATEGLTRHDAYRAIGERVRAAIEELRDGGPPSPAKRVARLLEGLPARHRPGRVAAEKSYYVKIGDGPDERWTISLAPGGLAVKAGKPDGAADCVVRAAPEVLERLLEDGDLPTFEDIATGSFKTNDPDALRLLVEALALDERAVR